jgi:DHA3 family macrolide efflux protein-like MFS transporter
LGDLFLKESSRRNLCYNNHKTMSQSTITTPPSFRSLFRDRRFMLIWVAQMISGIGDWALMLAIPVAVYNGTNSQAKLGLAVVAETLPALLFGLTAGVIVDRLPRRRVMIVTDLARMTTVLLLLNLRHITALSQSEVWLIYFVGFASATFSCLFNPARAALIPSILPRERLMEANSLLSSGTRLTQILGPGLGGIILFWLHSRGLFIFDALTFLVSAVCLLFVVEHFQQREGLGGLAGLWGDYIEGFQVFVTHPTLSVLIGILSVATFFGGIYNALLYAFTRDILHADGPGYGYLLSCVGFGALLSLPLLSGPFKSTPPSRLLAIGLMLMAFSGWVLAFAPNITIGAIAMFVGGFGNMVMYLPIVTMFQTAGPPHLMGRIMGAAMTVGAFFASASGLAAAGIVTVYPHLKTIYAIIPAAFVISGLLAITYLGRPNTEQAEAS